MSAGAGARVAQGRPLTADGFCLACPLGGNRAALAATGEAKALAAVAAFARHCGKCPLAAKGRRPGA